MRKCDVETPIFSISSGDVQILRVQELVDNPPALFVVRPGFLDTLDTLRVLTILLELEMSDTFPGITYSEYLR